MAPVRQQHLQEVTMPEFMKVFGQIASAKEMTMRELTPAVAEILKSVPDAIRLGVEEARKK